MGDRERQADIGRFRQLQKEIEVLDKILRDKRRARDEVKKRLNGVDLDNRETSGAAWDFNDRSKNR